LSVASEKPDHGIRVRLERSRDGYDGVVTTKDERWTIAAAIDEAGDVTVTGDAPEDVRERVRLMVRIEARNAKSAGTTLPRVIQRWRALRE